MAAEAVIRHHPSSWSLRALRLEERYPAAEFAIGVFEELVRTQSNHPVRPNYRFAMERTSCPGRRMERKRRQPFEMVRLTAQPGSTAPF
jgi:hypothetical protein